MFILSRRHAHWISIERLSTAELVTAPIRPTILLHPGLEQTPNPLAFGPRGGVACACHVIESNVLMVQLADSIHERDDVSGQQESWSC
jgi:hypothetical protein